MSALKRYGPGHDAQKRNQPQRRGESGAEGILYRRQNPAEYQIDYQRASSLFKQSKASADSDRSKKGQHHRRLHRGCELNGEISRMVKYKRGDGHQKAADNRRRDTKPANDADLVPDRETD